MSSGKEFLQEALSTSENKQFNQALQLSDQALMAFAQVNDLKGYAETYSLKSLIFRHLASYSEFPGYLDSALSCALLGAEIAKKYNLPQNWVMLFNAGKALAHAGKTTEAISYYDQTLTAVTQDPTIRKAIIADIKIHKDGLLLQQGETNAEIRIIDNIKVIHNSTDISTYERDVWTTGAYFHLVNALKGSSPEKAKEYLAQAKQIIEDNPELVIRKDQFQNINANL